MLIGFGMSALASFIIAIIAVPIIRHAIIDAKWQQESDHTPASWYHRTDA